MEDTTSWPLWTQSILVVITVLLSWQLRSSLRGLLRLPRSSIALCLLAPLLVAWLLPQSSYHFAGHEGSYGTALLGQPVARDDLFSYGTMPLPMGLSWLLGKLAPGEAAQQLWLAANRLALAPAMLFIAAISAELATTMGASARGRAAASLLAVSLCLASAPLAGWSATGYFLAPALALGGAATLCALRGLPYLALTWAALALGSRMELGPVLLVVLALVPSKRWREALRQPRPLLRWLSPLLACLQIWLLSRKSARLPVDSFTLDSSIVLENLLNIPLGGALFQPPALLMTAAAIALFRSDLLSVSAARVFGAAALVALLQPLSLIDVGARHFLPALLVWLPLVSATLTSRHSCGTITNRLRWALCSATLLLLVSAAFGEYQDLQHRYCNGQDGYLERWIQTADRGRRGGINELLEPSGCYVVMPGGEQIWKGASESGDVREIHNGVLALREGQCVRWAFAGEVEFSGSASAERVDRAISTLGLVPIGWLDPPPQGQRPWLLFGAEPREARLH
ncbi:MAG: hypothetical protein CMP23_08065 [Rickettsiales bacterium]|nr:hypothetical protein [Rickettsiales bacterium]